METYKKFTKDEELANGLSHLLGALLSVAALVIMVKFSVERGTIWHIVSTAVFGSTMIVLYLSSTMTHMLSAGKAKDFFFNLDRIAIYLLIAGTYTPISLITLSGPLGWIVFGIEWGLALAGTIMILTKPGDFNSGVNTFYVISYAVMGWLIALAFIPAMDRLPAMGWTWILLGGICYTLGIVFYKIIKFPYHHLVWHLLVIAGTCCHFFLVLFYIIP